jgi:hypothetical protein
MKDSLSPTEIYSIIEYGMMRSFIELVATGKRPDGTYNYCRQGLEIKAKLLMNDLAQMKKKCLQKE